jgi:hypothetical protein
MKTLLIIATLSILFALSLNVMAQDKVKYCKNYETGQIITVQVGQPCPYPTSKI